MNLFGRKKQAGVATSTSAASPRIDVVATMAKIQEQQQILEKNTTHLQKQVELAVKLALERSKKGDKKGALMQLKRKKNYEAEIEKLYGMITNLEAQTMALRSSTINQQYVAVAKEATAALKVQQEQVSVEAVDDLRDDFEEVMSMHTEMNQVLGQEWNTTSSMDDTELENELAELEAAEIDQSINAIPQAPVAVKQSAAAIEITSEAFPSAPLAPTNSPITMPQAPTTVPTKVVSTSMDEELAALEAGL